MNEPLRLTQHDVLPTASFLSKTYHIGIDGIPSFVKVYQHKSFYGGFLALDDEYERLRVMDNEVRINGFLAPGLNTRIMSFFVDDSQEEAIVMNKLNPNDFWSIQIQSGKVIEDSKLTAVARNLIKFHFNNEVCPIADIGSSQYSDVLRTRLKNEIRWNKSLSNGAVTDDLFNKWERLVDEFIDRNADLLEFRHTVMGEPRICHGDTRTENIADFNNEPQIIDPASSIAWQTLDRRMDAGLLTVDLEMAGRQKEAGIFWKEYTEGYDNKMFLQINDSAEKEKVVESNAVIDRISLLHRLGLIYSVARNKMKDGKEMEYNQKLAEKTFDRLQQVYQELEQELNSGQSLNAIS